MKLKKLATAILIFTLLLSLEVAAFAKDGNMTVKLNSGYEMPRVGLGTWTLTGKTCETAVYEAIKIGYRLIDTAKYYGNESEVGNAVAKAVKDGICKREEVFITTKIVPWSSNPEKDIDDSLAKLQVNYIDLVLLHQSGGTASDDKVYAALVKYCKAGKIKSIGISNFYTKKSVERFVKNFDIPPAVVQNENHIFYQNTKLQSDIAEHKIVVESYYPFGGRGHTGHSLQNPVIAKIATTHGKTSAQVIVRWHIQAGYVAIPGSGNVAHIAENFDVFDFDLTDSEMAEISKLNTNRRYENW